jgi:hypothetical protein
MLKVTLVFVMLLTTVFAQAKITGDVRVRPRMDTSEDGSGELHNKIYTLYWGRLNVDADIGGGWSFHSKLATNWVGHWSGVMGENTQKGGTSGFVDRPTVSLMEISMGKNAGNWGFRAGNLPLNGVANHIVDLHYYPTNPVDIPWAIYHLQSIQGFDGFVKAGPGKLNLALSIDENLNTDEGDGKSNKKTLIADYGMSLGGFQVKPQMAMTMANEDEPAPVTIGAGASMALAGFTVSGTFLTTSQGEGPDAGKYEGTHLRVGAKGTVGPGFLLAWYDIATIDPEGDDNSTDFTYLWLLYKYTIYSGDKGAVVVMPTARMRTGDIAYGNDYSRNKFELTFQLNFK